MNQKEGVSTLDGTTQVNAEILTNLHTYVISLKRTQFPLRERGSDQIYFDFKKLHDLLRKYIFHIFLHKILKERNILFLRSN